MNLPQCLRCTPAFAGVLVCALLTACATPQVTRLHEADLARTVASRAAIESVPFFAQKEYECGPAALAMLLSAAGVAVTPDALVAQVYLPARKGSLQVEMLAATRQRGLIAYPLKPALQDLLQEVAAGHPVLVFQNLSLPIYPVWHYAVAVAYDLERNTITLHSGETAQLEMSLFTFERTWARGNYWAMLALAPDAVPSTADASTYARSVAALESSHPHAARLAYTQAVIRWPGDASLRFGLGNSAYALHDLQTAASAYQAATDAQPEYADAWNNLAQVQLERGDKAAAKAAIARAVALGGPRLPQYVELQSQLANMAPD
jgi:tetratricopeptide (TPR) repeat protein